MGGQILMNTKHRILLIIAIILSTLLTAFIYFCKSEAATITIVSDTAQPIETILDFEVEPTHSVIEPAVVKLEQP